MAIRPDVELAPNITAATPSFPLGSSKNETAPAVNDGTPYNLTRANDIFGFQQALLQAANIVASGNTDTALDKNSSQYLQAVLHQVLSGFVFNESGAADAYVLNAVGNNPAPADYEDNMTFRFVATNTNTGASTIDVESLGVKNIFLDGAALTGGEILAGATITITFDVANDRFNFVPVVVHGHTNAGDGGKLSGRTVQAVHTQSSAVDTSATAIPADDSIPQNTEGEELAALNTTITPIDASNRLLIEIVVYLAEAVNNVILAGALFQDSTAGALSAGLLYPQDSIPNRVQPFILKFEMPAGTTSATTFKFRYGAVDTTTVTVNGSGGSRLLGGVMYSSMRVTEIQT